jgi:hypothetical protein
MTLKEADEIISEAKLFGWCWVVLNAECYAMTPTAMAGFWIRNAHMTRGEKCPRGATAEEIVRYSGTWQRSRRLAAGGMVGE